MKRTLITFIIVCALLVPGATAHAAQPAHPAGSARPTAPSAAKLSARWWKFVLSLPIHKPPYTGPIYNPLFDKTGASCSVGQSGPVWFLVSVFSASGRATRTCTIPAGKTLFMPLINVAVDNACVSPPMTVAQLRLVANQYIDATTKLHAFVDGVRVKQPFALRTQAPVFSYTLPARDNLAQHSGCNVSGTVRPTVADGFYLTLPPLSPGRHTINFGGTLGPPVDYSLNITYHLTIECPDGSTDCD